MHKHTQGCTQNQYIQDTTWAHTRPAHTLSSRQRYTSKLSVVENVDHTCQRNTVLSRVRLPSSPQSPPHSNILKAQSCQYNPTQSTKSPGKSPRVPALALPDQKGRGGERRSSATGARVGVFTHLTFIGPALQGPSVLLRGLSHCHALSPAT